MKADQYAEFQRLLKHKAAELDKALRDRKVIAVERTADAIDEWTLAADREMTTRTPSSRGSVCAVTS